MYASYAEEIINALANGINPITGEILPSDNVCNEPDVIRALYAAAELLKKQAEKEQSRQMRENAGLPRRMACWQKCSTVNIPKKKYASILAGQNILLRRGL